MTRSTDKVNSSEEALEKEKYEDLQKLKWQDKMINKEENERGKKGDVSGIRNGARN